MREDDIEQKFIDYAINNQWRIIQPEQDVINLVCHPKIKIMPVNSVVCSYVYDMYEKEEDYNNDLNYASDEVRFAMKNPIQLHYGGGGKPWNDLSATKAKVWFRYLTKTNFIIWFLLDYIKKNVKSSIKSIWRYIKIIISLFLPYGIVKIYKNIKRKRACLNE